MVTVTVTVTVTVMVTVTVTEYSFQQRMEVALQGFCSLLSDIENEFLVPVTVLPYAFDAFCALGVLFSVIGGPCKRYDLGHDGVNSSFGS